MLWKKLYNTQKTIKINKTKLQLNNFKAKPYIKEDLLVLFFCIITVSNNKAKTCKN